MIKKLNILLIALVTTQLCYAGATDDQEISLAAHPQVGESYTDNYYFQVDIQNPSIGTQDAMFFVDMELRNEITQIDQQENIKFKTTFNAIDFGSNLDEFTNNPLFPLISETITGESIEVTVSPYMQLIDINGLDRLLENVLRESGMAPPELSKMFVSELNNQIEQQREPGNQLYPKSIRLGETTEDVIEGPWGICVHVVRTSEEVGDSFFLLTTTFEFDSIGSSDPYIGPNEIKISGKCKDLLDRNTKMRVEQVLDMTLSVVSEDRESITVDMHLDYNSVKL